MFAFNYNGSSATLDSSLMCVLLGSVYFRSKVSIQTHPPLATCPCDLFGSQLQKVSINEVMGGGSAEINPPSAPLGMSHSTRRAP